MKVIKFQPGLIPVLKHGNHDQSSHGNWAEGSQGSASELSDDEIRDVIYNSKTVNEMFEKVAKRLGKSMKPSVENLSEDEITHYRGVVDVNRDAQRLLDGKIKFTDFQTWGQGIYLAEEKDVASNYGTLIRMKLDSSAKIVKGETAWDSAFDVTYDNPSARTRNTTTSDFIDLGRIETQIRAGKMDNLSISDMRNVYWAAKGYDGFTTYGETVLFNGSKLTVNKADIGTAVQKHQEHDQSSHGNWASGGELTNWSPSDPIPSSPRNAGGMTPSIWENWEHGPDGNVYVELYRQYAGEALGIAVPKSPMDVGGSENYLTERGFGGSSTATARKQSEAILKAIANGKPEQPALYRGMTATDADGRALLDSITKLKAGDTLDMPLVSTTRSLGVATWYAADRSPSGTGNVVMKIQPGAKGVSLSKETSYYPQDHEVITSGKFEVVSVNTVQSPYWKRETLQPRKTNYTDGTPDDYEVVGTKQNLGDPKKVYETVTSGNWKSLETPTFKLTDDRPNKRPESPVLSAWAKQPPREFTVVEVKFIEPHVVKKANDYGLTFDALFNNIPFFREEDVMKHGTHDQKTHGSWATGIGYKDSDKHPEYSSNEDGTNVEYYTSVGSWEMNGLLRTGKVPEDATFSKEEIRDMIKSIDTEIGKTSAPRDMVLFRGTSGKGTGVFEKLKEGDIYTDKGFISTTSNPEVVPEFMSTATGGRYDSRPVEKGYVLQVSVPKGSKVLSINRYFKKVSGRYGPSDDIRREDEHILPRGTKFRVDSIGTIDVRGLQDKLIKVSVVNDEK